MEDIVVRPRYPRHGVSMKKRKKGGRSDVNLAEKITRQLLISILVLLFAFAAKSIHAPLTDSLKENIRLVTERDIGMEDLNSAFGGVLGWIHTGNSSGAENTDLHNNSNSNTNSNMKSITVSQSVPDSLILPVDGVLVSRFGKDTEQLTQTAGFHNGIDIEAPNGTCVKAAGAGKVTETGSSRNYGNYVKISHSQDIATLYAHCSRIMAQDGQEVAQGDTIAEIGVIGASVGSHLHFEVWKNGQTMDPLDFINIISE